MKKSVICIAILLVIGVALSACGKNEPAAMQDTPKAYADTQKRFTLIVNGEKISSDKALTVDPEKQYTEIPLLATLKALGCQVEWVHKSRVKITYDDTVYILNPSKKTLRKRGDSFNIIAVMPGAAHGVYCEAAGEEVIIDSDSASYFLYVLGFEISIDYTDATITVRKKPITDDSQVDFSEWANGTLIVNGKVCEDAVVRIHPDGYAVIPILRIVKELGGTLTPKNEDVVSLRCNDSAYTLNTKDNTLIKNGLNYNLLDILCGKAKGVPYFAKEGDDYIVADEWAVPFLSDINALKRVDPQQNTVYIDTKAK